MPQTASTQQNRNQPSAHTSSPRGYSAANEELAENIMASFGRFYESSEVVSYYSPRFSLDDASIVERIANKALKDTLNSIQNLLLWDAGWNDNASIPPNQMAVSHAK